MSASEDTRRLIGQKDKLEKDAFLGRNGLTMTDEQRERYKQMQLRVKAARRGMAAQLHDLQRRTG